MKQCPKCSKQYADEAGFCLHDGTPLVSAAISPDATETKINVPAGKTESQSSAGKTLVSKTKSQSLAGKTKKKTQTVAANSQAQAGKSS